MNLCLFTGNIATDIQERTTHDGTKVITFRLAARYPAMDNGVKTKKTCFLDMEAWASGAEMIARHFQKGDPIGVQCYVRTDTWERDGQKRSKQVYRIEKFEFPQKSRERNSEDQEDYSTPVNAAY